MTSISGAKVVRTLSNVNAGMRLRASLDAART
jgi:hypothetical protein